MWDSGEMAAFWANYLVTPEDALNPLACPIHADVRGLPLRSGLSPSAM
jgi:hypothetical protein